MVDRLCTCTHTRGTHRRSTSTAYTNGPTTEDACLSCPCWTYQAGADDNDAAWPENPMVQLSGEDGNIFSILGRCRRALVGGGQRNRADEMTVRVQQAHSYEEALGIILEYVDAN